MRLSLNGGCNGKTSLKNKPLGRTSSSSSPFPQLFTREQSKNGGRVPILMGKNNPKGCGARGGGSYQHLKVDSGIGDNTEEGR
jgi:hypothetical protein